MEISDTSKLRFLAIFPQHSGGTEDWKPLMARCKGFYHPGPVIVGFSPAPLKFVER